MTKRKPIVLKFNKEIAQKITAIIISLATFLAGFSFILGEFLTKFDILIFTFLTISIVTTSTYLFIFKFTQEKNSKIDKTRFYLFALYSVIAYIVLITFAAIYLATKGQLAVSVFFFKLIMAINFVLSMTFWTKVSDRKIARIPIYALVIGVSACSLYFIAADIFTIKTTLAVNKDLIAVNAASVLGIIMLYQKNLKNTKEKLLSFTLFTINALTILLAQNLLALFTLTSVIISIELINTLRQYFKTRDLSVFSSIAMNFVILLLLNVTYVLISPNFKNQISQLSPITFLLTLDFIVVLLVVSAFIGKFLMREMRVIVSATLILVFTMLFIKLGDITLIAISVLLAYNLGSREIQTKK
jgi:hypothetical protein